MKKFIEISFLAIFFAASAVAQHGMEDTTQNIRQVKEQIQIIQLKLDSLTSAQSSTSVSEEDFERLEELVDKQLMELRNSLASLSRSTAPTILNPRLTTFINFAARKDNKTVFDETGAIQINNRPFLRTVEMELNAPVDPYADAVTILSVEDEAGTGFAIDAEEAYVNIKRLPILEAAPLGIKLKIGKFRAPFGINNTIHMHDLPWTTRPLPIVKYLGTEHGEFFESGFNTVGAEGDFFIPSFIPTTTLEMRFAVMRSGEIGLAQGITGTQPALVGRLGLSKDWNNEHLLLVGVSGYNESGTNVTQLLGADVTYKWAPAEQRESHSFVAGGEVFVGNHSLLSATGVRQTNRPYGWFGYAQYQLSYWTYLGVRYDWLQEPSNTSLITKALAGYISYYTTEFLRFRFGVENKQSDILTSGLNNVTSVIVDVNVVFGSHPVEPYWVNK